MEIREGEQCILLDFQNEDVLYVEWCDGQTRGGREVCAPGFHTRLKCMLQTAERSEEQLNRCETEDGSLYVEIERGNGYYRLKLAYVPEEDLLPWQWLETADYFRPAEFAQLAAVL